MGTNLKASLLKHARTDGTGTVAVISVVKTDAGHWVAELEKPAGTAYGQDGVKQHRLYGRTSPSVNELQLFAAEVLAEDVKIGAIRFEECTLMTVVPV